MDCSKLLAPPPAPAPSTAPPSGNHDSSAPPPTGPKGNAQLRLDLLAGLQIRADDPLYVYL